MDYDNVATTVFSPLEYGCVGLTEDQAIDRYNENNIEVSCKVYVTILNALLRYSWWKIKLFCHHTDLR